MRRVLVALACLWLAIVPANATPPPAGPLPGTPPPARPDVIRLRLSNVRQAQFAGYYVARARGYYSAAGLDVSILPGPADGDATAPARDDADIWSAWLPQALAAREHGLKLVNIAQVFLHSGLEIVCRKAGIHAPADLKGHTVGVWSDGSAIPFEAWRRKLDLAASGAITVLPMARAQGPAAVDPLLSGAAACITALNYDQYWQAVAAGLSPDALQVFRYGDVGLATLQDGLYATEATLAAPDRRDALVRFVRASLQGWRYAVAHQAEAVAIVLDADRGAAALERQTRMMSAVARLTQAGLQPMGYLEPAAFDRTVQLLLRAGPGAPISRAPDDGAWTHLVWKRATR